VFFELCNQEHRAILLQNLGFFAILFFIKISVLKGFQMHKFFKVFFLSTLLVSPVSAKFFGLVSEKPSAEERLEKCLANIEKNQAMLVKNQEMLICIFATWQKEQETKNALLEARKEQELEVKHQAELQHKIAEFKRQIIPYIPNELPPVHDLSNPPLDARTHFVTQEYGFKPACKLAKKYSPALMALYLPALAPLIQLSFQRINLDLLQSEPLKPFMEWLTQTPEEVQKQNACKSDPVLYAKYQAVQILKERLAQATSRSTVAQEYDKAVTENALMQNPEYVKLVQELRDLLQNPVELTLDVELQEKCKMLYEKIKNLKQQFAQTQEENLRRAREEMFGRATNQVLLITAGPNTAPQTPGTAPA
jgi:hypothetical protein